MTSGTKIIGASAASFSFSFQCFKTFLLFVDPQRDTIFGGILPSLAEKAIIAKQRDPGLACLPRT